MCKMCVLTFKNFDFPTAHHAFSRFKCWNLENQHKKNVDYFEATRYEATRYEATRYEATQNDADGGDGEPTSAMPHSHRQANTHRDQISRSGDTPSL